MKKQLFQTVFFSFLLLLFSCTKSSESAYVQSLTKERKETNKYFASSSSPLLPEDKVSFVSLNFYPIHESMKVECGFKKFAQPDTLVLATSSEREVQMLDYGVYSFEINGKALELHGYLGADLQDTSLFIPFNDLTNGVSTYGAGRYLDVPIPNSEKTALDFNKAYNPYCAYNYNYSCPIPPKVNRLEVNIEAGEKLFH